LYLPHFCFKNPSPIFFWWCHPCFLYILSFKLSKQLHEWQNYVTLMDFVRCMFDQMIHKKSRHWLKKKLQRKTPYFTSLPKPQIVGANLN
jgi:hypothetical protein